MKKLTYKDDNTFRIMQMTDTHIGNMPFHEDDHKTFDLVRTMLQEVPCDLVIHTGDIIWSDGVKNADHVFKEFISIFNEFNIPVAITFGNHDSEENISRKNLRDLYQSEVVNQVEMTDQDLVQDRLSYTINIYSADGSNLLNTLYLIDSGAGSDEDISEYEWVFPKQVDWFKQTASKYQQGDQVKRNIVFQHIPLPEYWLSMHHIVSGECHEENDTISSPKLNTGLFSAMYLNRETWGMTVGHDHNNNFDSLYQGLHLVYGQVSGFQCYGDNPRGVRIFELNADKQTIETHVVTLDEI